MPGHPLTQLPVGHPKRLRHLESRALSDKELLDAHRKGLLSKALFTREVERRFRERVTGS